jgi:hypothetical protein
VCTTNTPDRRNVVYAAAHTKHSRNTRECTCQHAGCTELIEFGLAAAEFGAHAPSEQVVHVPNN